MSNQSNGNDLSRDLFVLEDENNPKISKKDRIWPTSILDQIFDPLDPTHKNLRQIIADLRQEIITGGKGNIVFPVNSVNGKTGDVVINAASIGLGRVDNTPDIDKPLSVPQKESIMEILSSYDFNINMDELYAHLMDTTNPHDVTLDQINKDDILGQFVQRYITSHNFSTNSTVHMDIRQSLSRLWNLVDDINNNLETRVGKVLDAMDIHEGDELAHQDLFEKKEDLVNKVLSFSSTINSDHTKYPSTRAVVEFVAQKMIEFKETLPDVNNWIDDIIVVENRSELPIPTSRYARKAYFIRSGNSSHDEVAICRMNPDNKSYSWDISQFGTYSKFDQKYFTDTTDGLSIKMSSIIDAIISENGMLDTSLSEILSHYYKKEDIDNFNFVTHIKILPGTMDGSIRYYINDDLTTMSDDVKIPGLGRIAYLEWITENELFDQAVHENHIISKAVAKRHLQDHIVDVDKMSCTYGYLIGNTDNSDNNNANEVSLIQLADYLRPLIGGWPDPNTPGGNPWFDVFDGYLMHPHIWRPNEEQSLNDYSYAMRFTGEISVLPNVNFKVLLTDQIKLGDYKMIDAGGTWMYQSDPEEWTMLGGSNITGHTFGTVNMTKDGLFFESISIGNRMNASYDIWVKYVKTEEINQVFNPTT